MADTQQLDRISTVEAVDELHRLFGRYHALTRSYMEARCNTDLRSIRETERDHLTAARAIVDYVYRLLNNPYKDAADGK